MNKLFKPRYEITCQFCNRRPIGQYEKYDLYYCKSGPSDDYNWMAYDKDSPDPDDPDVGHAFVSVRYRKNTDKLVMAFVWYLLNE